MYLKNYIKITIYRVALFIKSHFNKIESKDFCQLVCEANGADFSEDLYQTIIYLGLSNAYFIDNFELEKVRNKNLIALLKLFIFKKAFNIEEYYRAIDCKTFYIMACDYYRIYPSDIEFESLKFTGLGNRFILQQLYGGENERKVKLMYNILSGNFNNVINILKEKVNILSIIEDKEDNIELAILFYNILEDKEKTSTNIYEINYYKIRLQYVLYELTEKYF